MIRISISVAAFEANAAALPKGYTAEGRQLTPVCHGTTSLASVRGPATGKMVEDLTMGDQKREAMRGLVRRRRTRPPWLPAGWFLLRDVLNGRFDEDDHVVPWSRTCDLDAEIMLIAQDWDSFDKISEREEYHLRQIEQAGRDIGLTTNWRIDDFLLRYFNLRYHQVFATDLFPFIKPTTNSKFGKGWLSQCARDYAIPQIDIIGPRMVICLGNDAYSTIKDELEQQGLIEERRLFYHPRGPLFYTPQNSDDVIQIYGVYHTSRQNSRYLEGMHEEWRFLASLWRDMQRQQK
jgi:uracil-DNA glycosylase